MTSLYKNLKLSGKITLLGLMTTLLFVSAVIFWVLPEAKSRLLARKKTKLEEQTQIAWHILAYQYNRISVEGITPEAARHDAAAQIAALRFGPENKDYFWINDTSPRMVVHPFVPALNGKDLSGKKDNNGKALFVEMVNECRRNSAGFVDYIWQYKDQKDRIVPKISHVRLFEPWNWIVGTGMYIEDINEEMAAFTGKVALILGGLTIFGIIISLLMAHGIARPIRHITAIAARLSTGDIEQRISLQQKDEVGQLAAAFEKIMESQAEKAHVATQISEGNLDVNIIPGSDRDVLGKAFEQMLESQKQKAKAAEMISRGDIAANIHMMSDRDILGKSMQTMIDVQRERAQIANEIAVGNLSVTARVLSDEDILGKAMAKMIDAQYQMALVANGIARGDLHQKVPVRSRHDTLGLAMKAMLDAERRMAAMARDLSAGKLHVQVEMRSEQDELSAAMLKMIDSQRARIGVAMAIARGDLSTEVELSCADDALGKAILEMKTAIEALVTDTMMLVSSALEGKLHVRANVNNHAGEWQKIVLGINQTLDAVVKPAMEASAMLEKFAQLDLRSRIHSEFKGDHAVMKNALNTTGDVLHDALLKVSVATSHLGSASEQIATSSRQVADGAIRQAASIQQTTSSLKELSSMIQKNVSDTKHANALAANTLHLAVDGKNRMIDMVSAMEEIRDSSQQTQNIIREINDIAFQTNLLALNAAVEAARAGDAGRSFSVVAEDVRNLAVRVKIAAQKTEDLVNHSSGLANNGERISHDANNRFESISQAINELVTTIEDVTSANMQQAGNIDKVVKSIELMDEIGQRSAANSEETSSAVSLLREQASEMQQMVQQFQLTDA